MEELAALLRDRNKGSIMKESREEKKEEKKAGETLVNENEQGFSLLFLNFFPSQATRCEISSIYIYSFFFSFTHVLGIIF